MSAYRCPYPLCKSRYLPYIIFIFFSTDNNQFSIKRRSAFTAHLKKHNLDLTYVDIDAMAPPLPPVPANVPKREIPVHEIIFLDPMLQRDFDSKTPRAVNQMYPDGRYL